jgi:hypothetical protein
MVRFIVTGGPILHDTGVFDLGSEIDLTADQARQLLDLGDIAEIVAAKAGRKSRQTEGDEGTQE